MLDVYDELALVLWLYDIQGVDHGMQTAGGQDILAEAPNALDKIVSDDRDDDEVPFRQKRGCDGIVQGEHVRDQKSPQGRR